MAAALVLWDLSTLEYEDKHFFMYLSGGTSAGVGLHARWRPNSAILNLRREQESSGTFGSSVKKKAVDVLTVTWDHKNVIHINILMRKAQLPIPRNKKDLYFVEKQWIWSPKRTEVIFHADILLC